MINNQKNKGGNYILYKLVDSAHVKKTDSFLASSIKLLALKLSKFNERISIW